MPEDKKVYLCNYLRTMADDIERNFDEDALEVHYDEFQDLVEVHSPDKWKRYRVYSRRYNLRFTLNMGLAPGEDAADITPLSIIEGGTKYE